MPLIRDVEKDTIMSLTSTTACNSSLLLDALANLSISIEFEEITTSLKLVRKQLSAATPNLLNTRAYLLCPDSNMPNTLGEYALFLLAEHGFGFDIEQCRQQGIDLNALDQRAGELPTALMKAIQAENLSTTLSLLKYAAPEILTLKNRHGQTVMQMAERKKNQDLIQALQPFYLTEAIPQANH